MAYMHMAVFVAQATHCQPCFKVHIMAATNPLGGHGGKRDNSGRKKKYIGFSSSQRGWNSQNKRIYLTIKIFDAWKEAKIDAGYSRYSDSKLAAHLLSLETEEGKPKLRNHFSQILVRMKLFGLKMSFFYFKVRYQCQWVKKKKEKHSC